MKFKDISGAELTLRILTPTDVTDKYVEWLKDPEVNQYLEVRLESVTLETQRHYVAQIFASEDTYLFGIFEKSNKMIGSIKLGPIHSYHKYGEIGIMIGDSECWGKGVGTKAIGILCDAFFEIGALRKATAGVMEVNIGSRKAFEKNEFSTEGVLRDQLIGVNGELLNVIRYGKINTLLPGNVVK